ncbi:MAG TPA: DUF4197 domain-containing protein [Chitinophagales bacterium]|nr:DUF4197 domain-containing protein [Chitinophagales bacterium]
MKSFCFIQLTAFLLTLSAASCSAQFKLPKSLENARNVIAGESKPTDQEVISGLKEALSIGSQNAAGLASKVDGYYKNPAIFIPFPPEAKAVEEKVRALGMGNMADDFVMTLNRAAEEAAKEAAPIFLDAVKQMTIQDGWAILKGDNQAATTYLKNKTTDPLYEKFKPAVSAAIQKVQVTKYWEPIINAYNRIPFVQKMNPDLEDYTTRKAIDGLFYLVGKEEEKIRKDPGARVTELLKKVFGYKG